ncbi:MAG TPA: tetratricopeptide repeat protein, partial [Terracidiphilus sp.]|nr:tetratricopeptide repeat protein [Terracidiphilus sp.]
SQSNDKSQPDKTDPSKRHSTAQDNPFPEAISRKAAAEAGDSTADAPAPSTAPVPNSGKPPAAKDSKSPAPDYSSSRTGLQNIDSDDPEARISDGAGGYIHDPKLAAQDIKVGQFYFVNQDYKGAYSRFKEATKVDPANADAVFGLAEAARALKLTSEAADNYRIYLDAFPDGSKAKSARKALAQLGEAPKK